jgi:hypothetical protein
VSAPYRAADLDPILSNTWPFSTKVVETSATPAAAATCRNECEYHVIPRGDSVHLGPNLFDNSRGLVTKDHRLHRNSTLAPHDVVVGAAKPNSRDSNEHLRSTGRVKLDLLDRQRGLRVAINGCSYKHGYAENPAICLR